MTITELVAKLEQLKDENGDIDVEFFDSSGYPYPIKDIVIEKETVLLM